MAVLFTIATNKSKISAYGPRNEERNITAHNGRGIELQS